MQSHPHTNFDPFAKVRSLSGVLMVFLFARASMRAVNYLVAKATAPSGATSMEDHQTFRMIQGGLLGVENLLSLVGMIMFLVWIYRVIKGARAAGVMTKYSPGMAVGGWFIPIANFVLPWLTVRDGLRAVQRPTVLAGLWWIIWIINIPLNAMFQFARQLMLVPELGDNIPFEMIESMYSMLNTMSWPYLLLDTAAWALLGVIVSIVRGAVSQRSA
ncbi:MAG: DUF4328 domain-containing protein [Deltaproteobacteria bacterium]|nr:DUF4328 domain-containing protein [Deltaproteobacteria bacterium]